MRILIISQYFYPENFRINDLADSFIETGHNVSVLTGYPNYPEGKVYTGYGLFHHHYEKYNNIEIIRVPLIPRGNKGPIRLFLNYISFMFSASLRVLFLPREKYDIIFVYEPSPITVVIPAIILKKIKKIPIFLWVLDLWPESLIATNSIKNKWILNFIEKFVRKIYKDCDKILISSKSFEKHLIKKDVSLEKIIYFPNWADKEYELDVIMSLNEISVPSGFVVLFAGNLGYAQDLETLVEVVVSLREYENIHFVILGDGRKYEWLAREIEKRKISTNLHLYGQKSISEVKQYFAKSHVLYLSLRDEKLFEDTVPGKLQSYFIASKPIIAAIRGETELIIKDAQNGITCEPGNVEMIKEAIVKMFQMDESQRKQMGLNGYNYYWNNFSRKKLSDLILEKMQNEINRN